MQKNLKNVHIICFTKRNANVKIVNDSKISIGSEISLKLENFRDRDEVFRR